MHRLFVALDLPAQVTEDIADICHGLNGMRWVGPDNLHLTLRFIGEVPPSVAHEVEQALAEIDAAAFSFSLVGIGHLRAPADHGGLAGGRGRSRPGRAAQNRPPPARRWDRPRPP